MLCNLGGLPDEAGQEEARWHPQARTSSMSRQASHVSHMSASQLDRRSESGFLEQLMPYESGLQVYLHCQTRVPACLCISCTCVIDFDMQTQTDQHYYIAILPQKCQECVSEHGKYAQE